MKRTRRRVSRKRNTSRKYSKKKYSKKYSKKRYSKKRISRKRVHRGGAGDVESGNVELGIFLKVSGDHWGHKRLFGKSLEQSRYLRIETPKGKDQSDRVLAYYKYSGQPETDGFSIAKTGEDIRLEDYHIAPIFSGTDRYGHGADEVTTSEKKCLGFMLYPNGISGRRYEFLWADGFLTGDYKGIYIKMYPSVGEGRKQVDFDKFDAITRRYNAEYGAVLKKVSRGLISPDELETALRSSEPKLALNQLIQRVEESEAEE